MAILGPHAVCSSPSMPIRSNHILPRCGLLLVLLAVVVSSVAAQEAPAYRVHPDYTVRQWTVRDGLHSNTINDLLLASNGYLWLATNEGLVRFDGAQFTVFNTTNAPQLPSNRFASLAEEPPGYLWIVSDREDLALYHEGRFTGFDENAKVLRHAIPVLTYGVGDTVLVGTRNGIARYTAGRLEPYRRDVIDDWVWAMAQDSEGRLWVGTVEGGLVRFDHDGAVRPFTTEDGLVSLDVFNLLADRAGRMWATNGQGVVRIDGDQVETIHAGAGFNPQDMDTEGGIWVSSATEGWWRHDPSGTATLLPKPSIVAAAEQMIVGPEGQPWRIGSTVDLSGMLASGERILFRGEEQVFRLQDLISVFQFDRPGNLWIGSPLHGLFRVQRSFLHTLSEAEGLPAKAVYPLLEDRDGAIWVGTFGQGLVRFDAAMNPTVFGLAGGFPDFVLALYQDHADNIWVGGIDRTCRVQGDRCLADDLPDYVKLMDTRAMHEDRQGRFWIGGEQGLVLGRPDGSSRAWTSITTASGLPKNWIRAITETRDGTILFGTNGDGILRYDERGGLDVLSTEQGLPSDLIRDLYEDEEGLLWIAFEDRGLCRLDRQGALALQDAALKCLDSQAGLYQSGLHRILEDDFGRFWFNTNNGIFWVERAMLQAFLDGAIPSVTSVSYTEAEGMRNREGNGGVQPAGIKASDGRLWFPTQDGVVIIDPRAVPLPEAPPVLFEGVQVGEEVRRAEGVVELSPGERDVTIQYTALEFARAEDVRFQYYLEGYDETWRDGGRLRVASYTNLSPGSYGFHVRAGIGGVWSEAARVSIERLPYFWETTWFLVLVGLVLLSAGPAIYTYRVRRLKAREAELEQIVEERTEELRRANDLKSRFLANISHEFRTPLTLTFGPLDDALQGRYASFEAARPHFERARRNGGRLLRLINQLLDLSKLDAGALLLRTKQHDLARHLRQLAALFDSIAETQGIHYSTRIPDAPLLHTYDLDKIEKVVINLLSNAFKFTPSGSKVALALVRDDDGATRIVVADTGPGIAEEHLAHLFDRFYQVEGATTRSHEGSGIGLALVKELVELHEGTIAVESQVGFGTRFTVRLPRLEAVAEAAEERLPTNAEMVSTPADERPSEEPVLTDERVQDISGSLRIAPLPEPAEEAVAEEATVVLVVEDNADMRAYIRAHLEEHFTVVEAENGRVGVERARDLIPDLVLSDVMMPEMDGLEACQALKADERTSHIPVVLLTARATVAHRIEGFESGADAYLPKPFNAQELQVRVRTLIAERRRLRARFAATAPPVLPEDGAEQAIQQPARPVLPRREAAFLEKVEAQIAARLHDAQFGVDDLAESVSMSRRQLHRKLLALTDAPPAVLIRRQRLAQAAALLQEGASSVKEVCYAVGFQSISSFSRAFRAVYGLRPSAYLEQAQAGNDEA